MQADADAMIAAPKTIEQGTIHLPERAEGASDSFYQVQGSPDKTQLILSVTRISTPQKAIAKFKLHLRHRQHGTLLRLEFGTGHHNPDCDRLDCPHLHSYIEGSGDDWAEPWRDPPCNRPCDMLQVTEAFLKRANIVAEVKGVLL